MSALDIVIIAACCKLDVPSHDRKMVCLSSPEPTPPMTYDRIALMVGKSLAAMTRRDDREKL